MDDFLAVPPDHDPERERARLLRNLRRAEGFSLFFVVCNNGDTRNYLIADLQTTLSEKRIQVVPVQEEIESLLSHLRDVLGDSRPDILVVYGFENWIPSNIPPGSIPFFATLNAARNSFAQTFGLPILFCLPEYLVTAIMKAAPDFFSVRSGIFVFISDAAERTKVIESLAVEGLTEAYSLLPKEREERIHELSSLLDEYRSLPEEQRDYAVESRLLYQMATNYIAQGDYAEAEPLLLERLRLNEEYYGVEHLETATALHNLAYLNRQQGKLSEAEPLYMRALEIKEKAFGTENPDTAITLNNLADLYRWQGKLNEAEPLYMRALEIKEKAFGTENQSVATTLNNLAELYQAQGNLNRAEEVYVEALGISEKVLGKDHPETATILNNLAVLYKSQGKYQQAEPLYLRALEISERMLGKDHPQTAGSLNNIAVLYGKQGRLSEAEPLLVRALEISERMLGKEHPATKTIIYNREILHKDPAIYREPSNKGTLTTLKPLKLPSKQKTPSGRA